jgi:hypothetical protein
VTRKEKQELTQGAAQAQRKRKWKMKAGKSVTQTIPAWTAAALLPLLLPGHV